jgi:hypothetical protein
MSGRLRVTNRITETDDFAIQSFDLHILWHDIGKCLNRCWKVGMERHSTVFSGRPKFLILHPTIRKVGDIPAAPVIARRACASSLE